MRPTSPYPIIATRSEAVSIVEAGPDCSSVSVVVMGTRCRVPGLRRRNGMMTRKSPHTLRIAAVDDAISLSGEGDVRRLLDRPAVVAGEMIAAALGQRGDRERRIDSQGARNDGTVHDEQ